MVMQVQKRVMMQSSQDDVGFQPLNDHGKKVDDVSRHDSACSDQEKENNANNTNNVNAASTNRVNVVGANSSNELPFDLKMPDLEDNSTFTFLNEDEDDGADADMNNLDTSIQVSPTPTTRIHKDHPLDQVIINVQSAIQTKNMLKNLEEHGIEAIRLFLAYSSFKDFMVDQVDVKSAFLYGKIKEERGKIDKTLFIRRYKEDILLVQVYIDDIIFGSTKKDLCIEFEKMMHEKFQMSSMGELTFFRGFQVKQKQDEIFISQDKYVAKILRKYGFLEVKNASTSMETQKHQLKDKDCEEVDVHMYRSMIGSLMYLTSLRPDIKLAVCACARYQVNPKVSHLYVVKRIFRYLKGHPTFGLWYPKDSLFDLVAYTNSDYIGASLDRKSTTGDYQFLREAQIHAKVDGKKVIVSEASIRRDLQFEDEGGVDCLSNEPSDPTKNVADEAVNEEMDESLEKVAPTATSLDADLGVEDASKHRRIANIDVDEGINLVNETAEDQGRYNDEEMFDTCVLDNEEVVVEKEVADKDVSIVEEVNAASIATSTSKPKEKRIVMQEPSEATTTTTTIISSIKSKYKGKSIMVEPEMPIKKKDQISLDEELALKLQAEEEEERLAREKAQRIKEVNIAWDDVQAKIKANFELAQRLQAEKQE
nr:hypothetical protein [Tanacetum cinerariifolium]